MPVTANQSQKIKDEFNSGLPDNIADFLEKTIPVPPNFEYPTDVDSAIQIQGLLAGYLLELFGEMAGFSIAAAMMHIGELNAVNQVMALASLRMNPNAHLLEIILPKEGTIYGADSFFFCEIAISGDLSVLSAVRFTRKEVDESLTTGGMLTAQEAVELELLPPELVKEGHFYTKQTLSIPGSYTYTFAADIDDKTFTSDTVTVQIEGA